MTGNLWTISFHVLLTATLVSSGDLKFFLMSRRSHWARLCSYRLLLWLVRWLCRPVAASTFSPRVVAPAGSFAALSRVNLRFSIWLLYFIRLCCGDCSFHVACWLLADLKMLVDCLCFYLTWLLLLLHQTPLFQNLTKYISIKGFRIQVYNWSFNARKLDCIVSLWTWKSLSSSHLFCFFLLNFNVILVVTTYL